MPRAENTKYSAFSPNTIFIPGSTCSPTMALLDKAVKVQQFNLNTKRCNVKASEHEPLTLRT